jgi:hypothetical protein
LLRLTTTATPANNDVLYVLGEITAAATITSHTLTLDSTSLTNGYNLWVGNSCTAQFPTAASTASQLNLIGIQISKGATFNIGSSITSIPSTSSVVLQFNFTTTGTTTNYIGGTWNIFGNAITNISAKLAADAAAAATSLTTNISTAWLNGDEIAISSTDTQGTSHAELKSLTANAAGTTLTISSTGFAHSGTSPIQCDLVNVTRNITIQPASAAIVFPQCFVQSIQATISWNWARFKGTWLNSGGQTMSLQSNVATMNGCAFTFNLNCLLGAFTGGTYTNNIWYGTGTASTTATAVSIQNGNNQGTYNGNFFIALVTASGVYAVNIVWQPASFNNNTIANATGSGLYYAVASINTGTQPLSGNTIYCCNGKAVFISFGTGVSGTTFSSAFTPVFRNLSGITTANIANATFDTCVAFGNTNGNIVLGSGYESAVGVLVDNVTNSIGLLFKNITCNGDTTFSSTAGLFLNYATGVNHRLA